MLSESGSLVVQPEGPDEGHFIFIELSVHFNQTHAVKMSWVVLSSHLSWCSLLRGSDQHNYTVNTLTSRRRLYVGLKAIHVNGALFFALLQVPWGNRWLLPLCQRPHALFKLHEPGHVRGEELVFDPWGRGPVVAIVVVTVHQRWGAQGGFGLAHQWHLGVWEEVVGWSEFKM